MDHDYQNLSHDEIIKRLRELHKRIAYIERTNMQASTLEQMRHIRGMLGLEMQSRIENKKLDMYNKLWPTDSKIIGDEEDSI
tara:strand:- start:2108 stop:2353 length:246 start_codon:yes stop_codon:yes gene_type:complete